MSEPARVLVDLVTEVLRVFPGAKVVAMDKPLACSQCSKEAVPAWRRGGKIVRREDADGRQVWACHYCGREVR